MPTLELRAAQRVPVGSRAAYLDHLADALARGCLVGQHDVGSVDEVIEEVAKTEWEHVFAKLGRAPDGTA